MASTVNILDTFAVVCEVLTHIGTITVEHHCDTGHLAVSTVDLILCRVEVSCETLGRSEETFGEEGHFVHSGL